MNMNDLDDITTKQTKPKRQRNKKQTQKELLNMYYEEYPKEKDVSARPAAPDVFHYLSQNEKNKFHHKFTKPKNGNQGHYLNMLNNKSKK
jgi:hypothetical protein